MKEKTVRFLRDSSRSSLCMSLALIGMASLSVVTGDAGYGLASIYRETDPLFYWAIVAVELGAALAFYRLFHHDIRLANKGESEIDQAEQDEFKRKISKIKERRVNADKVGSNDRS